MCNSIESTCYKCGDKRKWLETRIRLGHPYPICNTCYEYDHLLGCEQTRKWREAQKKKGETNCK